MSEIEEFARIQSEETDRKNRYDGMRRQADEMKKAFENKLETVRRLLGKCERLVEYPWLLSDYSANDFESDPSRLTENHIERAAEDIAEYKKDIEFALSILSDRLKKF